MLSLDSNKLALEVSEFALSTLIRQAVNDVTQLARERDVEVCSLADPSLPDTVIGDPSHLRTILNALLSSAIGSAGAKGVRLSVFSSGQSGVSLELTFEATGDENCNDAPRGLSPTPDDPLRNAAKLAELLGGELGAHRQAAAAPVFWCRVPVQQAVKRAAVASAELSSSHAKSVVRILMAEDNSINQRVGKLILQKAGYVIDLVGDGSEAVEAHRSDPYDMILMDCQMPTMDGFEATRRIRANSNRQPVIIAVTANALVGERERCLAAGMDDYLSKPFQAEQLIAIVKKWASPNSDSSRVR